VRDEVKRLFNPEFLNRLDEMIVFNALSEDDLTQVVELLVQQLNRHLAQRDVSVTCTAEAKKWIVDKTCLDRNYGARPLRRALQRYIEDPLSELLIQGSLKRPAFLEVFLDNNSLYYRPVDASDTTDTADADASVQEAVLLSK